MIQKLRTTRQSERLIPRNQLGKSCCLSLIGMKIKGDQDWDLEAEKEIKIGYSILESLV